MEEPIPPAAGQVVPDRKTQDQAIADLITGGVPLRGIRQSDGTFIVYYSLNTAPAAEAPDKYKASNFTAFNNDQNSCVKDVFRVIEQVAAIKFVESTDGNQTGVLRYCNGKLVDKTTGGHALHADNSHFAIIGEGVPPVLFKHGNGGYALILHETLHLLGVQHPGSLGEGGKAGGDNPCYTYDSTVMSYNRGELHGHGLGPYDVAALQYMYGAPAQAANAVTVVDGADLASDTLFAPSGVASIDFRKTPLLGNIAMDLSSDEFKNQIKGYARRADQNDTYHIGTKLAFGTQVQDVLTNADTKVTLDVAGNALPNCLQGGYGDDTLRAAGGNDTLTGRGGKDNFRFTPASGMDNAITDFNLSEDKITAAFRRFDIQTRLNNANGVDTVGAEIVFSGDPSGKTASVFVPNADPSRIRQLIRLDGELPAGTLVSAPAVPQAGNLAKSRP